jgi:chemotaxis protein methyltransferase CheR
MIDLNLVQRLTPEEFDKFAKLVYSESGIFLKDSKITLLSNRLRKRLQALSLKTFQDYYDYIQKMKDKSVEIIELIDVVSTNETYFFRNERHFDALMQKSFPDISKNKKDKTLTIWSAGCSTGEEPYTIAICVLECKHLFPGWKIKIMATDIAHSVLDFAAQGVYSGRRIEKVPPEYLKRHFIQDKDKPEFYTVTDEVKSLVTFGTLNLFKDKFPSDVDIIFCRNVMIYFDREHQKDLVANFYKSISKQHGYFYIGHSETLHAISEDFLYVKLLDAPVYIPKERVHEFSAD